MKKLEELSNERVKMILSEIININTKEKMDLVYEVKVLNDITSFTHSNKFNQLNVSNISFMKEDDTFTPQIIKYEAKPRNGINVFEFKQFFRRKDALFLLKLTKNDNVYMVYCRRNSDDIKMIQSTTMESFKFSVITETHFLKRRTQSFKLENYIDNSDGYSNSDHTGDNGYAYPHSYGSSLGNIDRFQLQFSGIQCDRQIYLEVDFIKFTNEPSIGLNGRWDEANVEYAYKCTDEITFSIGDVLKLKTFPLDSKIQRIIDYGSQVESFTSIEQFREFEINPYIEINPYEDFTLVLSNVEECTINFYEQYINI